MRVAGGIVPARGAGDPGRGPRGRLLRDGLAPAGRPTRCGRRCCATARSRPRIAAAGRRHAGPHPRGDRRPRRHRRALSAPTTIFHAIRLEPYLVATARAHPDLAAAPRRRWSRPPARTRRVLVHGDFSPEEHPASGPTGPVILDAECAWYGDPAFDLAFVLNHLLLKGVWRPALARPLPRRVRGAGRGLSRARRWEPWAALDARTAALLPGLLLARVDGKSPVEYLTSDADAAKRSARFARDAAAAAAGTVSAVIASRWRARTRMSVNTTIARRPRAAASGIRAAGRPSRPRSRSPAAPPDARSRRPARRAARARRSTCATAARASAASDVQRAIANVNGAIARGAAPAATPLDQAGVDATLVALDGTPEQGDARRQRDGRGVARRRARRGGRARTAAVAAPRRRRAGHAAAARDPDLRRRRARRPRGSTSRT